MLKDISAVLTNTHTHTHTQRPRCAGCSNRPHPHLLGPQCGFKANNSTARMKLVLERPCSQPTAVNSRAVGRLQ